MFVSYFWPSCLAWVRLSVSLFLKIGTLCAGWIQTQDPHAWMLGLQVLTTTQILWWLGIDWQLVILRVTWEDLDKSEQTWDCLDQNGQRICLRGDCLDCLNWCGKPSLLCFSQGWVLHCIRESELSVRSMDAFVFSVPDCVCVWLAALCFFLSWLLCGNRPWIINQIPQMLLVKYFNHSNRNEVG